MKSWTQILFYVRCSCEDDGRRTLRNSVIILINSAVLPLRDCASDGVSKNSSKVKLSTAAKWVVVRANMTTVIVPSTIVTLVTFLSFRVLQLRLNQYPLVFTTQHYSR